uniref:Serpin B6 n=1 Tax=Cyprinus carpio TaxID=7962 RepID=A0A8C1PXX0_CYPCA
MKKIILLFKLLLFLAQLVKMEPLTAANTQFSLNLFKKISGGNASGNVFYSPISISSALAMVSLGAKGNTAAQMFQVLGFTSPPKPDAATPASHQQAQKPQIACGVKGQHGPSMTQQTQKFEIPAELKKSPAQLTPGQKTEDQIHSSFNKLMSELKKPGAPYVLSLANRLYGEQSYQFVEKFLNDAKRYYEAGLEEVDFKKKPDAARVDINKWVEKNTQGKIKDLLPLGSIDAMTKLVLVNAIYFKGNWEKKFPKEATRDGQFKLNKTQTKPVKMMNHKAEFPLAVIPEMNSQVLELPYVGKNLSMLIILPEEIEDETTGLQKLEKALTYEKLMEWTRPEVMRQQEVQVSLPKFKMEETYDMKSLLISMGMEDVFNLQKVNLSGMSSNNDLVVSKVIHKAFVEVNEEGTEAAAATGVVVMNRCLRIPQFFNADHPFLFFIRHNPTKSILFYGRFCSP